MNWFCYLSDCLFLTLSVLNFCACHGFHRWPILKAGKFMSDTIIYKAENVKNVTFPRRYQSISPGVNSFTANAGSKRNIQKSVLSVFSCVLVPKMRKKDKSNQQCLSVHKNIAKPRFIVCINASAKFKPLVFKAYLKQIKQMGMGWAGAVMGGELNG